MPPIQARTREQLRVAIGYNLGAIRVLQTSSAGNGSGTTFVDTSLSANDDDENGQWWVGTSGSVDGDIRTISDYAGSSTTGTLRVAASAQIAINVTYELWKQEHNPAAIHEFINTAIIEATGYVVDPEESQALHADGHTARFDVPSTFAGISHVYYRSGILSDTVHDCNTDFDETTDADFTQTNDSEDYKNGSSLKLTIGGSVGNGNFITDSIAELDISRHTHLEGWFKATSTLAAADFVVRLDNGVVQGDSSDLEIISLPATTAADTWTFFRVALANPESDTAIISVGLEYNANAKANTVWFDDLRAVTVNSATWTPLEKSLWRLDHQEADLILTWGGVQQAGYRVLKLVGGDNPALLTSDATTNEIDDEYVILRATELALRARAAGVTDREVKAAFLGDASNYERRVQRAKNKFPRLANMRWVS